LPFEKAERGNDLSASVPLAVVAILWRMSTPRHPLRPTATVRKGEGIGDPAYLFSEIMELREIAGRAGLDDVHSVLGIAAYACHRRLKRAGKKREADPPSNS